MTQGTQTTLTPSPIRWHSLAQLAAIFLAIPAVLLMFGFNLELTSLTALQIGAALLTLLVFAWLIAGQRAPLPLRTPLLIWAAAYALAAAFAVDPRRSFGQAIAMSIAVLIFALVADLTSRGWSVDLWAKALIFTGVVFLTLDYFAFILPWYQRWLAANPGDWFPDVFYRLPSPNHQVAIFYLTGYLALARLFYTRTWVGRAVSILYLAALVLPLYLTSSRGGWLGFIAGLAVMLLIGMFNGPPIIRQTWHKVRTTPVLIAPLVFLLVAGGTGLLLLMVRLGASPSHGGFLGSRADYWLPAWNAFTADPITGVGPLNYLTAYLTAHSVPPLFIFGHAHNMILNTLAEMGLVGFLALVFLCLTALRIIYSRYNAAQGLTKAGLWAALASVFAFAVHNLFDTLHQQPVALWMLLIIVAPVLAETPQSSPARVNLLRPRPWAALLPVLGVWFYLYTVTPYYHGITAALAGDHPTAQAFLVTAAKRDPLAAPVHQQLALVEAKLAAGGDTDALTRAVASAERALELDPQWALNWGNLAALQLAAGNLDEARAAIDEAVRRAPGSNLLNLNLGVIAEAQSDTLTANSAYQLTINASPNWTEHDFWGKSPLRAALTAPELDSDRPCDYGEWISLVKADSNNSEAYLALANLAYSHDMISDADHWVQTGLATKIMSRETELELLWLEAELAAHSGDLTFAAKQSLFVIENYFIYGAGGPGDLFQEGYNQLAYRLPAQPDDFVPQFITPDLDPIWYERAAMASEWQRALGHQREADHLRQLANSAL